jgi:hypothetical protein
MPAPAPARSPLHPQDPLIDFDSNLRHQSGLRPPAETTSLPESSRERFSENWERLAFVAPRHRRSRLRRKLEESKVTGWMFSGGRFEVNAAAGILMLVLLLAAAFIYGKRILTNSESKSPPPAKTESR